MSSEKSIRSEALRKEGNEIYFQVRDVRYGPSVLRLKLGKAHKLYEEALKAASHDKSERASSYKNLATINWFWGKSEWEIHIREAKGSGGALQAIRAAKERIPKSLEFYILAFELGNSGAKPELWVTQVQETIFTNFFGWVKEQLATYRVCFQPILVNLCTQMDSGHSSQVKKELASCFYMNHVAFIFNDGYKYIRNEDEGDRRIEEIDYKLCLNAIKECYLPLDKARGIVYSTNNNGLIKQFENLKEKVMLHELKFESLQARCQGDALLQRAFFEEDEAVSMELVWDAIDCYRHSVSLSKEKDPESDAIALNRIGILYSSVLKSEKLAYPCHLQSTKKAQEIMCPRIADSEWYKYSSLKVHQHQIEQEKNAVKVEEAINVIKMEGGKSLESFLKFIYRQHSHPDPRNGEMGNIDTPGKSKAALRKAILAYHPDTNGRFHGHWRILCEEITKILNCKYKAFK